jgi:hypothetical protein
MQYLQAVHIVALLLATIAIVVAVTRGVVDAWRGREADGQHLAVVMLGREIRRQHERGEEVAPAMQGRLATLQVDEPRPTSRQSLNLRLAPFYFVGAVLLQWVVGRLMGQSLSLRPLAGAALLATVSGICVADLLHRRGVGQGRSDGAASTFVAILAALSALTNTGS